MKKYIFMAVAGMLALSSCSNDDNDQTTQNAPRQMTFTAGFGDEATTRATLSDKSVTFNAGDGISILSAKNDNTDFYTSEDGASVTFTGTATADSKFYAVYPYTMGLELSGTTISGVMIPSSQSYAASSPCGWDPAAPIAYATTTGTSLQFHNACALLKINNDRGDADMIEIWCSDGALTGKFSLDTSDGTLTGIDTYPSAVVQSVPIQKIYIAIAPGTKTNFRAVWNGGGSHAMKYKSSVTFEAGKIYDLGSTSGWDVL